VDTDSASKVGARMVIREANIMGPRRRAAIVPALVVFITVLLSFVALTVDMGYIHAAATELRNAVDSSALAGASGLPKSQGVVYHRATTFGGLNLVAGNPVMPEELGIVLGNWDNRARLFTPGSSGSYIPNAVEVSGHRADIDLFFARVMGINKANVAKDAVALLGAGFCAGLWGLELVTVDGDIVTDSYDSTEGLYGVGNIYQNGDVCSCRDIISNGGIEIRGDAMHGRGYNFIPAGTSYTVSGIIGPHDALAPVEAPDFEAAAYNNDNANIGLTTKGNDPFAGNPWNLYVTGNDSLTLAGGTYFFTSVTIDGQAKVTVTGPTEMYLVGPGLFTGGGIINTTQHPPNLVIYSDGHLVNLTGNASFYGGLMAPDSLVILEGTGDYYGMILARHLDIDGDAVIHVDEHLVRSVFGINPTAPILVR